MSADGTITIQLNLAQEGFDRDLSGVENKCKGFGSTVGNIFKGIGLAKVASKAFDTITGSIGKATDRLDSMQKSTRVMTALTGSASKATQIVNTLSDAVTDTAYGLDTASSSTQKLMTSGLGAEKSARYVKDLMDAVSFYGDGTNETLANVADSISKMNSSQKISADQWQRLTDAGIPVLAMFAEKTGKSMAEVQDAFTKGEISTEEFNDVLMDAIENGTESFPAVANSAKEMAGSFATSFANMQARVAIGVAGIITSLNEWLEANHFPKLQTMIADTGTVFKDFLNVIAKELPKALDYAWNLIQPTLQALQGAFGTIRDAWAEASGGIQEAIGPLFDGLKDAFEGFMTDVLPKAIELVGELVGFLVKNLPTAINVLKTVAPLIVAVGTAFLMWNVIGMITSLVGVLKIGFLNAIFNVSKAWNVLNATMAANPIGFVITIISALVAAFIYLWTTSEDFRNFWIGVWDAIIGACQPVIDAIVVFFTQTLPQAFQSFIETAQSVVDAIVDFFTVQIPTAFDNFITTVSQLPGQIAQFLSQIISNVVEWASQMIQNAIKAGQQFVSNVVNFITQLPGKVLQFLSQIISNVANWVSQMINNARQAGSQFLQNVITFIAQLPGKVLQFLSQVISNAISFASRFAQQAINAGQKFFNGIVNKVRQIPGQMISIGSDIVNGIRSGISSAWNGLTSWLGGLASGLVNKVKSALKIGSPSKLFALRVGQWIPPGITEGVKSAMPKALAQMEEQSKLLLGAFNTDGLGSKVAVETNYGNLSRGISGGLGSSVVYNVDQTINSAKALTPSEIASETKNMMRRLAWQ